MTATDPANFRGEISIDDSFLKPFRIFAEVGKMLELTALLNALHLCNVRALAYLVLPKFAALGEGSSTKWGPVVGGN
jgi:hypothetical protein